MITVADVMKLPSMYGATILAGHAGISNPVESVTVLEYGQITSTLDELFSQTEFQGNALIISSFATIADDVDAQCENIRKICNNTNSASRTTTILRIVFITLFCRATLSI